MRRPQKQNPNLHKTTTLKNKQTPTTSFSLRIIYRERRPPTYYLGKTASDKSATKEINSQTMAPNKPSTAEKIKYSLYSAIVFFVIASPFVYKLTSSILGKWVAGPSGCPTISGLVLHTIVFGLIIFGLMYM